MSDSQPAPPAGLTFEKALEELESLVARMEEGKLPLEESLAAYQRGAQLIRFCESKLADAQARIAVLDGDTLRDLEPQ
ncbi:MAG TPA: exodeoxyribonuclease VII small subunit [Usitatibacter sp.]|jgi:exodeoxyribonuclease VII small subunit|nr:exodeoxyribonuclease VII small subunit [Usitatibacter sp.]